MVDALTQMLEAYVLWSPLGLVGMVLMRDIVGDLEPHVRPLDAAAAFVYCLCLVLAFPTILAAMLVLFCWWTISDFVEAVRRG